MIFEAFLSDPLSPLTTARRNSSRREGVTALSLQSRQQAMGILGILFSYLVSAGYLAANPLALRRGRRRRTGGFKRPERFLDEELWKFVLDSIEQWPKNTPRQIQHYERSRWTIRFLYHTALRASEAAEAKASDFYLQRLALYDTTEYPKNSRVTLTSHFFPQAFRKGWRLAMLAEDFWSSYLEIAGGSQNDSTFDVPMLYFAKPVEYLLREFRSESTDDPNIAKSNIKDAIILFLPP